MDIGGVHFPTTTELKEISRDKYVELWTNSMISIFSLISDRLTIAAEQGSTETTIVCFDSDYKCVDLHSVKDRDYILTKIMEVDENFSVEIRDHDYEEYNQGKEYSGVDITISW